MDIEEAKKILKSIECGDDTELIQAIETVLAELDKQEKIINAMAEYIFLGAGQTIFKDKEEVKQYYEKKVSESNE